MNRKKTAYNLHTKQQSKLKLWLTIVLLMMVGLLIFLQINSSKFIGNNWRTNIVFHTEPAIVVSFAKQDSDKTIIFAIPGEIHVTVPFGYQQYALQAVWDLAKLEKKPDIFQQTIEDVFATSFSGWIGEDNLLNISKQSNIFQQLSKNFSVFKLLTSSNISNLSFVDRIILWWKLIQIQNNYDLVDLSPESKLIDQQTLADASTVKTINSANWFNFLTDKLIDSQIRSEGLSVEVRNSTQVSGVGQKFSQILTNFGAKVITLNNIDKNVDKCEILYNPKLSKSKLIKWLNQEYQCDQIFEHDEGGPDLIIILGKYYGDRWVNS